MNKNRLTTVGTLNLDAPHSVHPVPFTHIDSTIMKNILFLLIGGLLFVLCYRVSRWQTQYVNANPVNATQRVTPVSPLTNTNPSLAMKVSAY